MHQQFGTDPHTLHRTDSIDTSVAAAYSVNTTKLEETVYQCIKAAGVMGCTQDDVLGKNPGAPYSSITARFSALLRKNLIVDTGTRRKGRSGRAQRVVWVPQVPEQLRLLRKLLPGVV